MKKDSDDLKDLQGFPCENVYQHCLQKFEKALESVLEERRDFFVHEVRLLCRGLALQAEAGAQSDSRWIAVESLSRLRSIVGGRFQNLRKRWVEAGFPLREHRGDKSGQYTLNDQGWLELSNWILKQGFEVRLAAPDSDWLFELRPIQR